MAIPIYLAKTAAEFAVSAAQKAQIAWMACHFSPYATGITNLPERLPPGSLMILNDRMPIHGHDPVRIRKMLQELHNSMACSGLLLDFQRPDCKETEEMVRVLLTLPFPVCVSDVYARNLDCPIFLPPIPITTEPSEYLTPWRGREIWQEVSKECLCITVTNSGSECAYSRPTGEFPFYDSQLYCRYQTVVSEHAACFNLTRNQEDIGRLLDDAASYGVTKAIGLWQEFR